MNRKKRAIIIGAGPAGLTAAYELLTRTDVQPLVLEMSDMVGGLSRTVVYRGNRIDIGPHRFFSRSDRVMQWWARMLPVQEEAEQTLPGAERRMARGVDLTAHGLDAGETDNVMLVCPRKSRIYYLRRFFDYPLGLDRSTLLNLGLWRTLHIGLSYLKAKLFPIRREENLEQFFINRFGKVLYHTFFKSYTEKVWGVSCDQISAAWGAQRIKGLSVKTLVVNAAAKLFRKQNAVRQPGVETSLIERFLYPKYGSGQMWETCANRIRDLGGSIHVNMEVCRLQREGNRITSVIARDPKSGKEKTFHGEYVFSTMPVKNLVAAVDAKVPEEVERISQGLAYRDYIIVGLLLDDLRIRDDMKSHADNRWPTDTWIYIHEPDVLLGRLQILNNWSPCMVADPATAWIGAEYFCSEADEVWKLSDEEMAGLASRELAEIGIIDESSLLDSTVIRAAKAYPAYSGTYHRFGELRTYFEQFENLFLIGRNGMHRYNNQDHSMLAAMVAVDNIIAGTTNKSDIWEVNADQQYHEA